MEGSIMVNAENERNNEINQYNRPERKKTIFSLILKYVIVFVILAIFITLVFFLLSILKPFTP